MKHTQIDSIELFPAKDAFFENLWNSIRLPVRPLLTLYVWCFNMIKKKKKKENDFSLRMTFLSKSYN